MPGKHTKSTKITTTNKPPRHGGGDGGGFRKGKGKVNKSSGPRLPSAFRKHLDSFVNPNSHDDSENEDDDVIDSDNDGNNDLYEYEEELAEEESTKNRRFDSVDNYEYQLPDKFKDEDILSDDDDDDGEEDVDSDDGANGGARHARMLQDITGIPTEAFQGKKRKRDAVISEAYPESEFNPTREVLSGNGQISLEELLDPLRGTSGYSKLRKKIQSIEKKGEAVQAPLPKPDQERVERSVAYDQTKKDITKWEQLVKRNREAPTLYFDQVGEMGLSTVGAIASEFKPRTDFEKAIASILDNKEVAEAYKSDGAKLLELNKISVQEVKDRQDRLAKMRSLLFRHEMKAKQIKKIKSKTYHRMKKKDKLKAATLDLLTDPKSARELAEKQERMRAEARMTLRHKNQGKWAKRVLERGLSKQDEGTRAAIAEQLHQHNLLTRKMNSMKDSSSSDDSEFDDDDDDDDCLDGERASKLLAKAKEKTIKLMEQEDEVPLSGVATLPFMVRGLEKRKEAANEEAKRALQEYDSSLNQDLAKGLKIENPSGRRVFGTTPKRVEEVKVKQRLEIDNFGSDNENNDETNDDIHMETLKGNHKEKNLDIDLEVLREGLGTDDDQAIKSVIDVADDPGQSTSYDVSVFTSGTWKKIQSRDKENSGDDANIKYMSEVAKPTPFSDSGKEVEVESDTDSGDHMIDGILSSGTRQTYELPSNEELIKRAFAGDDVEGEFEKAKEDVLNEENPEPEKPVLIPGWGEWTDVQAKKGIPYWMRKEHADAKKKREASLKKRKDARLKHVIVSEKVDKKEMKLLAESLPFPYTSKEDFERVHRMPIGPEFNPASTAGALIRPEVVKKPGMIINPIKFEEVDPHERVDEQKRGQKRTSTKRSGKNTKHDKRR